METKRMKFWHRRFKQIKHQFSLKKKRAAEGGGEYF